jgi:hypothetical protein
MAPDSNIRAPQGRHVGRPAYDAYVRRGLESARRRLAPAVADREYQRSRAMSPFDAVAEGLRPPPGRRAAEG